MLSVTKKPFGCAWLAFVLIATTAAQDRISAEQILTKLDRMRQPARSFAVSVAVTEFREGKKHREATFRMFARKMGADFDSLTVCLSPAVDLNKVLLARGNKLWFY